MTPENIGQLLPSFILFMAAVAAWLNGRGNRTSADADAVKADAAARVFMTALAGNFVEELKQENESLRNELHTQAEACNRKIADMQRQIDTLNDRLDEREGDGL